MDREQKKQWVEDLQKAVQESQSMVVSHYAGLNVADMTRLRRQASASGAQFTVTKNSLTKIALKGTPFELLSDLFSGPTAISFSSDPVAAAKAMVDFSKENEKLVILGGALQDEAMDIDQIKSLAKLPSLDELRGQIVGMINTPATRVAGVLQAPGGQVARVLNAYAQQ